VRVRIDGRIEVRYRRRPKGFPLTVKNTQPIRFGVTGMGGYAATITDRFLNGPPAGDKGFELIAACDPAVALMPDRTALLKRAGIELFDSLDAMLTRDDIDFVWLPVPIQLHRPFTEKALAAGKHVVCEKPAAGCVQDVDAMIQARNRAGKTCLIGFQDVYQQPIQDLKQRLISGELGRPLNASVIGYWPRPLPYFRRNNWAGKLKVGDTWVLDSPANNAMAHFIHLALYLLGQAAHSAATPNAVSAELYRANDIENFDTCTIQATLEGDIPLLVAMTHACRETIDPEITITTDRTVIRVQINGDISYHINGQPFRTPMNEAGLWPMVRAIVRHARGDTAAPVGTLEMARAHTVLINAASQVSPVYTIPPAEKRVANGPMVVIDGIEDALRQCVEQRQMLHESGLYAWTRPAGRIAFTSYEMFSGVAPLF
jgi:predicted dehydrogenase